MSNVCSILSKEVKPGGGALVGPENPGGAVTGALETVSTSK